MKISKYSSVIILFGAFLGFVWPNPGISLRPILNILLMILIFLSCLEIDLNKIVETLKQPKLLFFELLIVHLASPILIYIFLKPFISPELFVGLILVSTVPVGRSAVFLSNLFGGLPEKALVISSLSNLISPITLPLITYYFTQSTIKFDAIEMGSSMAIIIIIPFFLAIIFRHFNIIKKIITYQTDISTLLVAIIVWGIIAPIHNQITAHFYLSLILTLLSIVLMSINFGLGYLLGSNQSEKITYAISATYKNYSLATIIAAITFPGLILISLPSLIYSISNNLLLIPLQYLLKSNNEYPNHR
ncbi:MAG: hypothetical protein Q7R95_10420 [bacterium]|nr:hypothetical protein [bacterium]